MKTNFLSDNIYNYIVMNHLTVAEFIVKLVDNGGESITERTLSKWKNGDTYPKLNNLIALSKLFNVTIDSLLKQEMDTSLYEKTSLPTKLLDCNEQEINVLKLLLKDRKINDSGKIVSSLYCPYSYNSTLINTKHCLFNRDDVVLEYKKQSTGTFINSRLDYLSNEQGMDIFSIKQFVSKVCSVIFVENYQDLEHIIFDNSDTCYKQLQAIWSQYDSEDIYNVIYFCEKIMIHDDESFNEIDSWDMDKDSYYKIQMHMNKIYKDNFKSLIDKKIITPLDNNLLNDSFIDINEKLDEQISVMEDYSGVDGKTFLPNLKSILFNFKINLTEKEIQNFIINYNK